MCENPSTPHHEIIGQLAVRRLVTPFFVGSNPSGLTKKCSLKYWLDGGMVDTLARGASAERRRGSSPLQVTE